METTTIQIRKNLKKKLDRLESRIKLDSVAKEAVKSAKIVEHAE